MKLSAREQTKAATRSAARKRFDQLLGQIEKQREQLAQFRSDGEALLARWGSKIDAQRSAFQAGIWTYVQALDALTQEKSPSFKLSAAQRKILSEIIAELLDVLESCPDPAQLDALYQRHRGQSVAEKNRAELQDFKDVVSQEFGAEFVAGFEGESIEEFAAYTQAGMKTREHVAQADELDTQGDLFESFEFAQTKQRPTSRRKQQEQATQMDMEQSIRELFRKLISDLHPDREPDLALRERKSEWMKRANIAYKSNDILGLWTVQAEFANQSQLALEDLSEARLKGFNVSLVQQLDRLKSEQLKATVDFSHRLQLSPEQLPKNFLQLERVLQERNSLTKARTQQLMHDLAVLKNPNLRMVVVKQLCADHRQRRREEQYDDDFLHEFEHVLSEFIEPQSAKGRRASRRR